MHKTLIDVHEFDGKLVNKFTREYSLEQKTEILSSYNPSDPIAQKTLLMIIADIGKPNNYLEINGMDASDLLVAILELPQTEDLQQVLEEQLIDIDAGKCNSGRCTRLYQVWSSFKI
jgi:hypothetical protein